MFKDTVVQCRSYRRFHQEKLQYWRDVDQVHFVPKRAPKEVLIEPEHDQR